MVEKNIFASLFKCLQHFFTANIFFPLTMGQHNIIIVSMIPAFDSTGNLPPGLHRASFAEVIERYATNYVRMNLIQGLQRALESLAYAGCARIFLDGSFVTTKEFPDDYDACWDTNGVDLSRLDPVFVDFSGERIRQKIKYNGEFFPAHFIERQCGKVFLEFFQTDPNTGLPKGIIEIPLQRVIQ